MSGAEVAILVITAIVVFLIVSFLAAKRDRRPDIRERDRRDEAKNDYDRTPRQPPVGPPL